LPDSTITGWSIIMIPEFADALSLGGFPNPRIAAFKPGFDTIELDDFFVVDTADCSPISYRLQTPLPARPAKLVYEGVVRLGLKFLEGSPGDDAATPFITGLGAGSASLFVYLTDPSDNSFGDILKVPGALRVSNLSGVSYAEGPGFNVVSGSVNFGASKPVRQVAEE
jgi:hypothetical protein